MSFNSKKTITDMAVGTLAVAAYIIYALSAYAPAPEDLKAWATVMLVFIGISVVAAIVVGILFHIVVATAIATKKRESDGAKIDKTISSLMAEDERDKLITLKASHIGYSFVGVGFVAALVALALGASCVTALHILLGALAVSGLADGVISIFYYEKGVRNV